MNPPPAFDSVAVDYDRNFTDTRIGRLQRMRVWHWVSPFLSQTPNRQALELNCGTGADALWLAKAGFEVLATDISPEMIAAAHQKATAVPEGRQIRLLAADAAALPDAVKPSGEAIGFGLVFSNFGGLNCLSPDDLQRLSGQLALRLAPGGCFAAVVMGRFCIWETFYFLLKGRFQQAFRRRHGGPVAAALAPGHTVKTWYYSPREFARFFPGLTLQCIRPVGICLPPSYLEPFFARFPRLLNLLHGLEHRLTAPLWARAADHYLILMKG